MFSMKMVEIIRIIYYFFKLNLPIMTLNEIKEPRKISASVNNSDFILSQLADYRIVRTR